MADAPAAQQAFLQVKLQNVDITTRVRCVEVEDNDRLMDKATVVIEDPNGDVANVPREGQRILIDMGWLSEHGVLFEGEVQHFIAQTRAGAGLRGKLTAYDLSCRMMQGAPKTKDHKGPLSQILKAVIQGYPVQPGDIKPDPDYDFTDQPLRQTNLLDWQFIQALAERFGARAFVEYNGGASKFYWVAASQLTQGDPLGELKYSPGFSSLLEFRYQRLASSASAGQTAVIVAPGTGTAKATPAASPAPPESAASPLTGATSTPADVLPVPVAAGLPSDPNPAAQVVAADPTRQYGLFGEGVAAGTIKLRAKARLAISNIAPWAAGTWYVRRATHVYTPSKRYHTRFIVTR